ncbi:MAG: HNH endonuclease [Acidobacteria bacterium]|nr:HNH endonuclease [Acidobacteriota bacterium]
MKFQLEEFHRNVTDDDLIADLKHVANDLNKRSVTSREYNERGKFSAATLQLRFGSWLKALEKAGLQKTKDRNITEEELFEDLERTWIKLGRQPRFREMGKPLSKYSPQTYAYRFDTWQNALGKFVDYVNKEEQISSEEAIKNLEIEPSTRHKTKRTINWRLNYIVIRRDYFKCKACGRSPATDPSIILHVDHIKAWANGGETVLENLQTLCSKHNIGKSDLE